MQWSAGVVHMLLLTGVVPGQVPQFHVFMKHVQFVAPNEHDAPWSVHADPSIGCAVGHMWQCQVGPAMPPPPQLHSLWP
jgi:hypothetical protein